MANSGHIKNRSHPSMPFGNLDQIHSAVWTKSVRQFGPTSTPYNSGSSGINVGQTEEAEDLYLYADASHTQIFRPNRRGYNARANDLNLSILWLDF